MPIGFSLSRSCELSTTKKLTKQENLNREHKVGTPPLDPQQKFNRFVKSLLDALFGSIDAQSEPGNKQSTYRVKSKTIKAEKPAFNFHYNLAMEKNKTPYTRGEDGVFRKAPQQSQKR